MKTKILIDAATVIDKVDGLSTCIINLKKNLPEESFDIFEYSVLIHTGAIRQELTLLQQETALPAFINSLDIYVHATPGETMSTAIMQVMACRVPVIASAVLGVNNMIKHDQSGLLVRVKDPEQLRL